MLGRVTDWKKNKIEQFFYIIWISNQKAKKFGRITFLRLFSCNQQLTTRNQHSLFTDFLKFEK